MTRVGPPELLLPELLADGVGEAGGCVASNGSFREALGLGVVISFRLFMSKWRSSGGGYW